ncbi:hypothetical protein [Marinobacterium sp. BA1]|uniref:hypothetical protein n=2 Tax=Marinobacterium sp. BA1 TaxID=3138931 RepID=UPI0032E5607D
MKISNPIYIGVIHIACFIVGYVMMQVIFSHSDSRNAYSLINAWWLSLYVGLIVGENLRCLIAAFPVAAVGLTVLYLTGLGDSFYHDAPTTLSFKLAFVVFMQSVVIVSPILINSGVGLVTKNKMNVENK